MLKTQLMIENTQKKKLEMELMEQKISGKKLEKLHFEEMQKRF
jgi:hypothetical protein